MHHRNSPSFFELHLHYPSPACPYISNTVDICYGHPCLGELLIRLAYKMPYHLEITMSRSFLGSGSYSVKDRKRKLQFERTNSLGN